MPYSNVYRSPLGDMLMQSEDGESLCRLVFCDGDDEGDVEAPQELNSSLPLFADVKRWLDSYFSGKNPPFTSPLLLQGTDFQLSVWNKVMEIPSGQRTTYNAIAKRVSRTRSKLCSARGVGGALARNPIAIIVPCHRVLGANGELKGYRWGKDRKQMLLIHEAMGSLKGFTP